MHGPDIPQIEVQQSMARIREATSKTQETPAIDKCLIIFLSFRQTFDKVSTNCPFQPNVTFNQLSYSTKCRIRRSVFQQIVVDPASPLWKTVSITFSCIIPLPSRTPVVSIALHRKKQIFGAALKFDPHFWCLMGSFKSFWWRFQWKRLEHVMACCLLKMMTSNS